MNRLRDVRKSRGISQFELAKRTGLHPSVLSRIENGKLAPFPGWRRRIAGALGVDEGEIFSK